MVLNPIEIEKDKNLKTTNVPQLPLLYAVGRVLVEMIQTSPVLIFTVMFSASRSGFRKGPSHQAAD